MDLPLEIKELIIKQFKYDLGYHCGNWKIRRGMLKSVLKPVILYPIKTFGIHPVYEFILHKKRFYFEDNYTIKLQHFSTDHTRDLKLYLTYPKNKRDATFFVI